TRAKKRSQCWAFVIGRTTANITITFFVKHKRLAPPLRLVRRLHIKVVIDSHSWPIAAGDELCDYDRIAGSLYRICLFAEGTEITHRRIRAAFDVGLVFRLGADCWNLDPLT